MQRVLLIAAGLAALFAGCAATPPRFQDMRTPSGEFCTDMTIYSGKTQPDREFHRLEPIQSEPSARTEPERLRSLRKAACMAGGDAVIEAIEEEVRLPDASYGKVAAGTAIVWTRRDGQTAKPLALGAKTEEEKKEAEATPPPEGLAPPKEPTPVNTAVEVKSPPPPPPPSATATATASATPPPATSSSTKTKTTTKTTTKK